jgi:hypothetical protein
MLEEWLWPLIYVCLFLLLLLICEEWPDEWEHEK